MAFQLIFRDPNEVYKDGEGRERTGGIVLVILLITITNSAATQDANQSFG